MARLRWERARFGVTWTASRPLRRRFGFVLRELLGRRCTRLYELRGSGLAVVIRHPLVDVWVLKEVFAADEYRMPPAATRALAALGRPPRVLDLGGNIGLFALRAFEQMPGATVVSFEPDPRNLEVLRRCAAANPSLDWEIVPAAAGTAAGSAKFISDFGLAQLASVAEQHGGHSPQERWLPPAVRAKYPSPSTVTVNVVDVLPHLTRCDLAKIDIEGAEWELLSDPRFAATSAVALAVEAHPRGAARAATEALDAAFSRSNLRREGMLPVDGQARVVWGIPPAGQGP